MKKTKRYSEVIPRRLQRKDGSRDKSRIICRECQVKHLRRLYSNITFFFIHFYQSPFENSNLETVQGILWLTTSMQIGSDKSL